MKFYKKMGFILMAGLTALTSACSDSVTDNELETPDFVTEDGFRHRSNVQVEEFATGFDLPTSLAFAPDGSGRLFVNELQSGQIKIIQDGNVMDQPFANVETMVDGGFPVDGENGLIGIAFDPNFQQNGYLYISFAVRENDNTIGRIARLKDVNNTSTDFTILIDSLPSAAGHQVESLRFGPDEKLYIMVGDAFEADKAQDPETFHGKFLRMNRDGTVPADNPDPESLVFALGFRNNFDFIFRPNGDLVTTENGPSEKDEMNVVLPDGNYGWPEELGTTENSPFNQPVHVWQDIVAPSGMHFYQGVVYTGPGIGNPIDVTEGPDGNIYFTDIFRGIVYKISAAGS